MENALPMAPVERLVGQPLCLPLDSIVCGDNCDVLGTFPRECIDLVVTSPPYDDLRTYGGHSWDFYGVAWQATLDNPIDGSGFRLMIGRRIATNDN